ncbi:MAG: hypothetical protein WBP79_15435 [Candidatus Acidiferrales bacterium]
MREARKAVEGIRAWRRRWMWSVCAAGFLALCPGIAHAQATEDSELEGINSGDYNVKQSIEFGGRFTDFTGNKGVYDTFVNLRQGPRLLGMNLEMSSLDHNGLFFDRLSFSNFGYGGDPNDVTRLRISKNKWYNFDALFRRDENAWDYNTFANPLNPGAPAFANAPAGFQPILGSSPHLYDTVRRMGDYNLTLLPQSKIRFRLGYSHNRSEGPSLSTIHQGTEQLLLQDLNTTVNAFRFGVDYKVLPRTNISYDQILSYYKGDTTYTDPFATTTPLSQAILTNLGFPGPFQAASAAGPLVDLGVSYNVSGSNPCGGTFVAGGFVNRTCSAYFDYLRDGRLRTSSPTEQFSFVSNYWKDFDLTGRFSYSGGSTTTSDWIEALDGRESRSNLRNQVNTGTVSGQRVNASADLGVAWHASDRLSLVDSFHFSSFHNPVTFDTQSCTFFSPDMITAANVFNTTGLTLPASCAPPVGGVANATPAHSSSSSADVSTGLSALMLKQDEKTNLFEVDYRFSSRLGARVGYRFRHREIDASSFEPVDEVYFPSTAARGDCATAANCTALGASGALEFQNPNPAVVIQAPVQINEHSGLFGIWARPLQNWRISYDMELMSADNSFTRISPRQTQEYRVRTTYRPVQWATIAGSIRVWEGRNNIFSINSLQHDRSYGFSISLEPVKQFAIDMGSDYIDTHSQILICYASTAVTGTPTLCPTTTLIQTLSVYSNQSTYGHFDLRFAPIRHLTAKAGANITYTNGTIALLSPIGVPGPLNSRWYQPYAGVDYSFTKNWMGRAYWGFYDYSEDLTSSPQDVLFPRNFRGNLETISVRYAF